MYDLVCVRDPMRVQISCACTANLKDEHERIFTFI